MNEQSQQHKSGNSTPALFSQIVSSNDMPTSGKWSLKKRKSSSSGKVRSQFVKNTKKGRTLVVGSNKNTSLISNRRFHIFVTRVSLNTDDECVAQYIKNQPIISSCELINVSKEGSRNKYFHAIIETDHINTVLTSDFWPTGIAARRYFFKQ